MRAEADSSAKAGPANLCGGGCAARQRLQRRSASRIQRIRAGETPARDGAAGGARKEGSKATEPQAADERSSGSAGSWKTCPETAEGLQPEKPADVPLTATAAPGKQRSADEAMTSAVPGRFWQRKSCHISSSGQRTAPCYISNPGQRAAHKLEEVSESTEQGSRQVSKGAGRAQQRQETQPHGTRVVNSGAAGAGSWQGRFSEGTQQCMHHL